MACWLPSRPALVAYHILKLRTMPNRALRAVPIAAVAAMPLCLMSGVFLSHDVIPKVILALTSAALLLFFLPQGTNGLTAVWNHRQGRRFLVLVAAQAISLMLSTLFSSQPALSFAGTVWRRFGSIEQMAALTITCAALSFAVTDALWVRSLFRAISVTGGVGAVYGIAQFFGFDPFIDPALYKITVFGGIVRPPATMGHAIYFAAWLTPVALLAARSAAEEPDRIWKRVHGAVALLASVAILLSGTRGAVLAVAAGAAALALRDRKMLRRFALAAAGIAIGGGLLALLPAGETLRHRLYQWRQDLGGPRMMLYREAPALMLSHPVLGTGPETFAVEFRKIESAEMSRAYPDFYHETPHNALIDAAVGQGAPGLLILGCLFALGMASKKPGIQAALIGIFVSSQFASFTIVEAVFLWTLTGLAVAPTGLKVATRTAPKWVSVVASVSAVVCIGTALLLAVPDAADQNVADAVADKDFRAATESFDTSLRWSWGLPGYELFLSRQMATLGRALGGGPQSAPAWAKASEASELAEKRGEERFSAAYQSSVLAIVSGDLARSEGKAREAIELAPNWYKPHMLLSQILSAMGKSGEAATEQAEGTRLNPPVN